MPVYDEPLPVAEVLARCRAEGRSRLTEYEAAGILRGYGIPMARGRLCRDVTEAVATAGELGYPVVMKVVSPDILHKTDAGCVVVGVADAAGVHRAWEELLANARAYRADAAIHGILVQEKVPPGTEVILGVKNDPHFGPVLMFGLGGILVEVLEDVALRLLPVDRAEAGRMIRETRAWRLLEGVRGRPPADVPALLDVIERLSRFVQEFPAEVEELDLNPFFLYPAGRGGVAVDALLTLKES